MNQTIDPPSTTDGNTRRNILLSLLRQSDFPISGAELAKQLNVSRQVIVQDIALLRANQILVVSTHTGYLLQESQKYQRVFKVIHTEQDVPTELSIIVDHGGEVKDVFIYHKVYDIVRADLHIRSRRDIKNYLEQLKSGSSSLLMKVTNGYHYHTVEAENEEILDEIQQQLSEAGFLAKLQDYEPVDFWKG